MTYYRLAFQERHTSMWIWKSTILTSLEGVFQLLRIYNAFPAARIRVFTAASKEELAELLNRENNDLASGSLTAAQFLRDRGLHAQGASAQETGGETVRRSTSVAIESSLREHHLTSHAAGARSISLLDQQRLHIEQGLAATMILHTASRFPFLARNCWPEHGCWSGCRRETCGHRPLLCQGYQNKTLRHLSTVVAKSKIERGRGEEKLRIMLSCTIRHQYHIMNFRQGSNELDSSYSTERPRPVILSEAKDLTADRDRPFAEFTLERSEGLRVTLCDGSNCQGLFFTLEPCLNEINPATDRRARFIAAIADLSALGACSDTRINFLKLISEPAC